MIYKGEIMLDQPDFPHNEVTSLMHEGRAVDVVYFD